MRKLFYLLFILLSVLTSCIQNRLKSNEHDDIYFIKKDIIINDDEENIENGVIEENTNRIEENKRNE